MSSLVFDPRVRKLARLLACMGAALAVALAAGCGGGGGDSASPTVAMASQQQVAALARVQQAVSGRMARPQALAAVSSGTATEDFESGMADWQNWGNAQVVAGAGTSGSNALQVGTGAGGAALRVPGIVGGTTYRLTAQVRTTNPSESVALGVLFYDAAGHGLINYNAPHAIDTAYRTLTFDALAPANSAYALVWVWKNAGTGYAYVDDISLGVPAIPPDPLPPVSNLISNGGFEDNFMSAWPWQTWGNARIATVQSHSGSLAMLVGSGAAGGAGQEVGGIVPGTVYRLVAHAMVSYPTEAVFVGVSFNDQAGNGLESRMAWVSSTTYSTASFDITAPPHAASAVVFVWKNDGSGFGYLDDVAFGVAPDTAPPVPSFSGNLVVNGGFESGLANWVNWGNAGASAAQPAQGSAAAQVGSEAGGIGQFVEGIVAGNTYRLSGQVQVSRSDETGYLGVKFMDASGMVLQDSLLPFDSITYATAQLQVTAPPNATRALVYVWKNAGSGLASVDEIALAQVAASAGP
jgi:hypothetical protein